MFSSSPIIVHDAPAARTYAASDILVLPLAGINPTMGYALSAKMAWGLREAGYPAKTASVSDRINPVLTGWIKEISPQGDLVWLNIDWITYDSTGTLLGTYQQKISVSKRGWDRLTTQTVGLVVADAVPIIHEMINTYVFPGGVPPLVDLPVNTQAMASISQSRVRDGTVIVSGTGMSRFDSKGNPVDEEAVEVMAEQTFAKTTPEEEDGLPSVSDIFGLPEADSFVWPSKEPNAADIMVDPAPIPEYGGAEIAPASTMVADPSMPKVIPLIGPKASSGQPVFLVRQLSGAPGDGNLSLQVAMKEALRAHDVMTSDDLNKISHIVHGSVRVEAPFAGRQRVKIVWQITDIKGADLGSAVQENFVPQGLLDQPWGGVARIVAEGAVDGISQLFDQHLDSGGALGGLVQPDLPHVVE